MNDETDPILRTLFDASRPPLPAEPFVSATLARVVAWRRRASFVRGLLHAAAVVAVIWASPLLIEASVRLSALLDALFALAGEWLGTPIGMLIGLAGCIAAVALKRRRIV
jgi:hypothetical protein